jgi:hypothetical protein
LTHKTRKYSREKFIFTTTITGTKLQALYNYTCTLSKIKISRELAAAQQAKTSKKRNGARGYPVMLGERGPTLAVVSLDSGCTARRAIQDLKRNVIIKHKGHATGSGHYVHDALMASTKARA